jgi:O-antigen/teichoic acid export membrane protein
MVLVWATVFLYFSISGGYLLVSAGKEKVNLAILALAALANIALNLLWIPTMGFVGAALSTAITFLIILIGVIVAVQFLDLSPERPFSATGCAVEGLTR